MVAIGVIASRRWHERARAQNMVGRTMRSAYWVNHDPSGLVEAGYGPATKQRRFCV
jgi:hypothetical protein